MELYLDLVSQPCRSVFMFARKLGIPFEYKSVDLSTGQQYSPEFTKISPVNKVPVMKDGDFILTESTAILEYMAQKTPAPDHWFPADLQQRARVNEYLSWQHTNMRLHGSKLFMLRIMYPVIMDSEVPKEKMDAAVEDMNKSLQILEDKFLQGKPFIVGDKISLADLVALVEIMQPVASGFDVFTSRPKLGAWKERVKKEMGETLFDEAHEKVMKIQGLPEMMKKDGRIEQFKPIFRKYFT